MIDELHDRVQLSALHLFFDLPDEPARRAFVDRAVADARAALDRFQPSHLSRLPALAHAPREEIQRARERVKRPHADLRALAAANRRLFAARDRAAARGDGPLADRLFRDAVIAAWRTGKQIAAVERASTPAQGAILGEVRLPGGATLRLVAQTGHRAAIRAISFAPGGRWLVTASDDGRAISWDVATGRELRTWWPADAELRGAITGVALSADGGELVVAGDRGDVLRLLPDGERQLNTGSIRDILPDAPAPFDLASLPAAGVGRAVEALGEPVCAAATWPFPAASSLAATAPLSETDALAGPGPLVALGTESGALFLVDGASGEVVWSAPAMRLAARDIVWSAGGERFDVTGEDGATYGWDATAGRLVEVRPPASAGSPGGALSLERVSPDSPSAGQLVRDRATGEIVGYVDVRHGNEITHLSTSRARDRVLALHADGSAFVGALPAPFPTGPDWLVEPRYAWSARFRHASAAALSPDGHVALVGREDGVLQLWDVPRSARLCHAIGLPDGRWAVSDEEGRYDASSGGAAAGLHWVLDAEPIELDQLKARYHDPFLLAKKLGHNPEPPRRVAPLAPRLPPAVTQRIEGTGSGQRIHIVITDRGGGIGPVSVAINGKEAFVCRIEGGEPKIEPRVDSEGWRGAELRAGPGGAREMACVLDLAGHPYLRAGERDEVRVIASDEGGTLASRDVKRRIAPSAAPRPEPHLWAIVAGVARYAGERLRLRYAARDAEDFGAALSVGATALFGADRIHVRILSTDREKPAEQPTRAGLSAAFEEARRAASGDVLVIYLAGHGALHREGPDDDFHFLTQEAELGDLEDAETRKRETISSEELTAWIQRIPALKQVLILDSCHSGQLAMDLVESRDVPSSQVRALERMKDRTGVFVLAGAAAGAVSFEASRYAHGLLTHALLFGMRGPGLREGDLVDVQRLAAFAVDEVPRLAEGIRGVQRPVLAAPVAGASFDIGHVPEAARRRIPVTEPLPVLVRAAFQDRAEMDDVLGLGAAVDAVLRERSGRAGASFVLVGGESFPGAHRLLGAYSVVDGQVTVTVRVVHEGRRLVDDARFEGPAAAPGELVERIVARVVGVF